MQAVTNSLIYLLWSRVGTVATLLNADKISGGATDDYYATYQVLQYYIIWANDFFWTSRIYNYVWALGTGQSLYLQHVRVGGVDFWIFFFFFYILQLNLDWQKNSKTNV
jgi:hypothetical protein